MTVLTGTLLAQGRRTVTAAGFRLLAQRLAAPLTDPAAINARLDAIDVFVADALLRGDARTRLRAAPDLARIDLAGQPAAPQASARAFWSRSRGLVFTASNLPAPPAGRTYQLWILTAQPAPVSAGLLKPDANGRVNAVFETPADLPKPTAMAVTIEPDGGVPAPTGDKYLVGLATSL